MAKVSKATGAKRAAATTATPTGATAKAPAAKKAVGSRAPSTKATAKKAPTKAAAKKATANKAPAKAPSTKATAKKEPTRTVAKKAPAKKAPAKRATATTTRPTRASKPFDARFLAAQKAALLDKREQLLHEAAQLTAEANELAQMREPGDVQFDEESGEGDTLAVERERDLALAATFRSQIEEIDHALAKIEAGTYGLCEVSGQPIPKERLKAIPWARERVEYKVGGFGRR